MFVGAGAAAVVGAATSALVLRGTDLTRLIVTLGVASILYELANRFDGITGGADGLHGVNMGPLLGYFTFGLDAKVRQAIAPRSCSCCSCSRVASSTRPSATR